MEALTRITTIDSLPTSECLSVTWSHNNKFLVVTTIDDPFLYIYKNNFDGTFTLLDSIDVYPPFISNGASFNRDDSFLSIIHEGYPFLTIYEVDNTTLTFQKIANFSGIPISPPRCCKFNPNGNHLIIGKSEYPFFDIYYNNGNVFGKIASPLIVPTGRVNNIAFNSDGSYVTLVHDYYPYKTTYKIAANTFTIVEDDDIIISGEGIDVIYSTGSDKLIVINDDNILEDGNFLTIYAINSSIVAGQTDINLDDLNFVVTDRGFLFARGAVIEGKINVTEGSVIAGNTITNNYIYGEMAGVGTGSYNPSTPDDITNIAFWAGDTFINRESAEFRVYNDGRVYMSNAYVEGEIHATAFYLDGVNILNVAGDMFSESFMEILTENITAGIFTDKIIDPSCITNTLSIGSYPDDATRIGMIIKGSDGTNYWDLVTRSVDSIPNPNQLEPTIELPNPPILSPLISGQSLTMSFNDKPFLKSFKDSELVYASGQWSFENAIVQSNSYFESANIPWEIGTTSIIFNFAEGRKYTDKPIYFIHPTATTEVIIEPRTGYYTGIRIYPVGGVPGFQVYNFIAFCKGLVPTVVI